MLIVGVGQLEKRTVFQGFRDGNRLSAAGGSITANFGRSRRARGRPVLRVSGLDQSAFERLIYDYGRQFKAIEFRKCPRLEDNGSVLFFRSRGLCAWLLRRWFYSTTSWFLPFRSFFVPAPALRARVARLILGHYYSPS